jgi:hypothetical protein
VKLRLRAYREPSFWVQDDGVAVLIHTLNDDGDEWLQSRYKGHRHLYGGTLVVPRTEAGRLLAAIRKAGLAVCFREDEFV